MHYCTSYGPDKFGRTHGRTHIHRTKIVTTMSRLPVSGIDKNNLQKSKVKKKKQNSNLQKKKKKKKKTKSFFIKLILHGEYGVVHGNSRYFPFYSYQSIPLVKFMEKLIIINKC